MGGAFPVSGKPLVSAVFGSGGVADSQKSGVGIGVSE